MVIHERSVTKHYWLKMYRHLFRRIQADNYDILAIDGQQIIVRIPSYKNCVAYAILIRHRQEFRPIAWLCLHRKDGWVAWEVIQVFAFEMYRGQGLAKKLYAAAINIDNQIVASGKTQSKYSRGLWASFVRKNSFDIYAIDYLDFNRRSQIFWDRIENEIWTSVPIYRTWHDSSKADVRLIATRKSK